LSPETTQRICALVGIDDDSRTAAEAVRDGQEPMSETSAEDDDEDFDVLVRQPVESMGAAAVGVLLEEISGNPAQRTEFVFLIAGRGIPA
jgi:hypothetical protein